MTALPLPTAAPCPQPGGAAADARTPPAWRHRAHMAALHGLIALLAACGGGGDGDGAVAPTPSPTPAPTPSPSPSPTPPPPAPNQAPVPRFEAPTNVVVGQPVVLDGRGSSDPEGSVLRFVWQFGDGTAGGEAQLAHVYPAAGTYSTKLLVVDSQGATAELTRSISVSAATAASRTVPLAARITGTDGLPLAGVAITVESRSGGGANANNMGTTATDGRANLTVGAAVEVVLRLAKAGYTDQVKRVKLPATVGTDASFEASLMPRAAPLTLADAAAGGIVTGTDGVGLSLPAGALVDASSGAAISGPVSVTMTPVDVNAAAVAAFPGVFEGLNADGTRTPIVSFGTTEFLLTQNGRPLQLKPGMRASIDLPVYASQDLGGAPLTVGGSLPLWSLDERSATWVNEGNGSLVAAPASPTGLTLRAEVAHFSWWNADKGYTPYRPKPKCINDVPGQYDSIFEQATICKMLAEMDKPIPPQGAGSLPERSRAALAKRWASLTGGPSAAGSAIPSATPSATTPRFPFPAVRIDGDVPMAGGVAIDIPPDYDVVLTGTALNGTWRGQVKVKGGQGATADVNVPIRPVAVGGQSETITLPFDAIRSAAAFRLDSYRFSATAGQGVDITLAPEGSTLTGTLRLRNAAGTVLDATQFGPITGQLRVNLPTAGDYTIEMQPATGAPGGYRLKAGTAVVAQSVPSQSLGTASPASQPVVVGQGSSAMALWVQAGSSGAVLVGSRYLGAADGWSQASTLASAAGYDDSQGLQALVDDAGQVWVAWSDGSGPRVARGPLAAGTAWAAPVAFASANCPGGLTQRLAINPEGQGVLVWQRKGSSTGWCARRFEGGVWGAESLIASTPPASGASLALVLTPAGQAVAAWPLDNFGGLAQAQQDSASAGWSAPQFLAAANTINSSPAMASAGDGSLVLAWVGSSGLMATHRPAGLAWKPAVALGSTGTSANPQVAWLGGDRHVVAFNSFNSGPRVAEHLASTGWGATAQAVATNLSLPIMVSLAAGSDGSAMLVAVANARSGIGTELGFVRRDPATGAWVNASLPLAPRQAANSSQLPRYAAMAVSAGQATAAWLEFTTDPLELRTRAARLAATP